MMRVAFNATALLSPATGIGQYTLELARGLTSEPGLEGHFFYGAYWSNRVREAPVVGAQRGLPWLRQHLPYSYALRRWVQAQRFAAGARRQRFHLYHEPNILSLPFDGPTLLTVHDLSWIQHPQAHPKERVQAMDQYFPASLQQASHIITDAESVRQELVSTCGVQPDRITTIPLGVSPIFRPHTAEQTAPLLQRHGLQHRQYWLTVGTLEPRKNLLAVVHAYRALPLQEQQRSPLVMVGLKGWGNQALEQALAPLEARGLVRRLGYLPRAELPLLMSSARALVYPSWYEGFGLPPLEAMACATPVIVSNTSSLPEVVGATGIQVPPDDPSAIAAAMHRLLNDPEAASRLGQAALARSQTYTWAACLAKTFALYRAVANNSV